MAFSYGWRGSDIVTNGLQLLIDAASPNSYYSEIPTAWNDASGNNYNSELVNGPVFNNTSGPAISFDGVDDYADFGLSSPLNGASTFTINMWCNVATLGASSILMYSRYNTQSLPRQADFLALVPGTVNLIPRIHIGTATNATFWTADTESVLLGEWQYVTFTMPSLTSGVECYVNGVNVAVTPTTVGAGAGSSITLSSVVPWRLTRYIVSNGTIIYNSYLLGQLSIYNRVLTQQEILKNYNETKTRYGL